MRKSVKHLHSPEPQYLHDNNSSPPPGSVSIIPSIFRSPWHRSSVHSTDSEGDRRLRRDTESEVPRGRLSHRGDPLGARRAGAAGWHKAARPAGRLADHQSGAEGLRFRSLHVLGEEQAGSQRPAEWRGDGHRLVCAGAMLEKAPKENPEKPRAQGKTLGKTKQTKKQKNRWRWRGGRGWFLSQLSPRRWHQAAGNETKWKLHFNY